MQLVNQPTKISMLSELEIEIRRLNQQMKLYSAHINEEIRERERLIRALKGSDDVG